MKHGTKLQTRIRHSIFTLALTLAVMVAGGPAFAQCANPVGAAGDQMYNATHDTMQYCDGTDWTAMKGTLASLSCTDGQVAAWNNTGSAWECADGGVGGAGSSMVDGWPDAITCTPTSPALGTTLVFNYLGIASGEVYYRNDAYDIASLYDVRFDPTTKAFNGYGGISATSDCLNKSISQLYTDNQAFNFVGGGSGGGGEPVLSGFPDFINCTAASGDTWLYEIGSQVSGGGNVTYHHRSYDQRYMTFSSAGAWVGEVNGTSDCSGQTLTQLETAGQTGNHGGGGSGGGGSTVDFDAVESKTANTTHTAASAGIVTARIPLTSTEFCSLEGLRNGTSVTLQGINGVSADRVSISFPVADGETYRVDTSGAACGTPVIYLHPLSGGGSGGGGGGGLGACPSGFTEIGKLGCMQDDEEGSGTWPVANDACFDNYEGRLPFSSEWHAAMANYTLSNETGNIEWLSDYAAATAAPYDAHGGAGATSVTDFYWDYDTTSRAYRCFIPN